MTIYLHIYYLEVNLFNPAMYNIILIIEDVLRSYYINVISLMKIEL